MEINRATNVDDGVADVVSDMFAYHQWDAIRKLREARMDCNSAITHDGKY